MTGPNRSTAVMARRIEPDDSLDFFPTHPWATRAFVEHGLGSETLAAAVVAEPACGQGDMARPLAEYARRVVSSDIFAYGHGAVVDFLSPQWAEHVGLTEAPDWIITNPPFNRALEFALTALERARIGVALFARPGIYESIERYQGLWAHHRAWASAYYAERVPLVRCRLDEKAQSATAYTWVIWRKDDVPWPMGPVIIPPCSEALKRPGDYTQGVEFEPRQPMLFGATTP